MVAIKQIVVYSKILRGLYFVYYLPIHFRLQRVIIQLYDFPRNKIIVALFWLAQSPFSII